MKDYIFIEEGRGVDVWKVIVVSIMSHMEGIFFLNVYLQISIGLYEPCVD